MNSPSTETQSLVRLTVNGSVREAYAPARRLLSDFLRDDLGLTGTHVGCEHGVCGACTVFVNGEAVRSCLMFAAQAQGADIVTIEGVATDGNLHPLQRTLSECHGLQCGFCTPGMVIAAIDFLRTCPEPTVEDVKQGMSGNICRCTGYKGIIDAILKAAPELRTMEGNLHREHFPVDPALPLQPQPRNE